MILFFIIKVHFIVLFQIFLMELHSNEQSYRVEKFNLFSDEQSVGRGPMSTNTTSNTLTTFFVSELDDDQFMKLMF